MLTDLVVQPILNRMARRHPHAFKKALLKTNPKAFAQEISRWEDQSYDHFKFRGKLDGFEDIVTLFTIGRFNRGVIRLELDEAAELFNIVSSLENPVGVEIGRGWGGSTILLAIAVGDQGKINSIEIEPKFDEEVDEVLRKGNIRHHAELIVGDSNKVKLETPLDFAFIDGCHDYAYAKNDHLRWGREVKKGGFVIHHDMTDERPDASCSESLLTLRDEILERQADCLETHSQAGSLMVFKKISDEWTEF